MSSTPQGLRDLGGGGGLVRFVLYCYHIVISLCYEKLSIMKGDIFVVLTINLIGDIVNYTSNEQNKQLYKQKGCENA